MPRDTAARITNAARKLFLAQGVEGLSMRLVADKVGLTATAIYRHFQDKEALLDALTEVAHGLFRGYLERGLAKRDPVERLRAIGAHYLDFALDHPHDYELLFLVRRKHARRFPRDFAMRNELTFHLVSEQVSAGIEAGLLAENDPMEVALTLWTHVHGLVVLQRAGLFGASRARLRATYQRSVEFLFDGLKATDPRSRS